MSAARELAQLFRRDLTRLIQELEAFSDPADLWRKLPGVHNCAGTLALHLEGNLREYIGRQLGGVPYQRHRDAEFNASQLSAEDLIRRIEAVNQLIPVVVAALSPGQLEAAYPENVFNTPLSTQQFLFSLYGHLNYHLGQIDYLRRIATRGKPVEFAGLDFSTI